MIVDTEGIVGIYLSLAAIFGKSATGCHDETNSNLTYMQAGDTSRSVGETLVTLTTRVTDCSYLEVGVAAIAVGV